MVAAFSRFCLSPAVMVMVVYAVTCATVVVVGSILTLEETLVVVLRLSAFPQCQVKGLLTFSKLLATECW